jgi:hypothetical protein
MYKHLDHHLRQFGVWRRRGFCQDHLRHWSTQADALTWPNWRINKATPAGPFKGRDSRVPSSILREASSLKVQKHRKARCLPPGTQVHLAECARVMSSTGLRCKLTEKASVIGVHL